MCLNEDLFTRGLNYLYQVRDLALDPNLIDLVYHHDRRLPVCIWIGQHIEAINLKLRHCLQACHDCFHPWEQRSIQIFAAPFADSFGIDGLCNVHTQPMTILVDVGRVVPQDWLALVAHEYAHAHLGSPGHHPDFVQVLSHLCRGLGLALPSVEPNEAGQWRSFPPYRSTGNGLAFWQGQSLYGGEGQLQFKHL